MTPESLMPALRSGVAGFLLAIASIITPLTAVIYEHRPSTVRETPPSRDYLSISPQSLERGIGVLHIPASHRNR